eukprot:COSAG01_NODE_8321_length_2830_cov_11.232516_1_plen_96_part_00
MSATGISLMHAGPNQGGSQARIDHSALHIQGPVQQQATRAEEGGPLLADVAALVADVGPLRTPPLHIADDSTARCLLRCRCRYCCCSSAAVARLL